MVTKKQILEVVNDDCNHLKDDSDVEKIVQYTRHITNQQNLIGEVVDIQEIKLPTKNRNDVYKFLKRELDNDNEFLLQTPEYVYKVRVF